MPDEELKNLLQKNLETSQESLKILKKINRTRIIGNLFGIFKWLIIIGISAGIFYYIQPYVGQLKATLNQVNNLLPR